MTDIATACCIVGGGPAGMMTGYLLARAGISVTVIEKHNDFLRDFRGDTVHPSTLQVMDELGLFDRLLSQPHHKAYALLGRFGSFETKVADFSRLPTRAKFIAFMPQWDFLNFLAGEARSYPCFQLLMQTEATDLLEIDGKVSGVVAKGPGGPFRILSQLVIGCDGRHAMTRVKSGLPLKDIGAPMDVLWFRLSRQAGDPAEPVASFGAGHIFIMIARGDYWQCGYVIAKGGLAEIKQRGIAAFQDSAGKLAPFLKGRERELDSFDGLRLLSVGVDRLTEWHRPGLICIGDAAHTMSPVGGVGINIAIQDAVAAANLLAGPLSAGSVSNADLAKVQARRDLPARLTQWLQVQIQNRVIKTVLGGGEELKPPFALRLLERFPVLANIPGRIAGMGFRPEHVSPAISDRKG